MVGLDDFPLFLSSHHLPQAVLGGNSSPSEADIKKILSSGEGHGARSTCMLARHARQGMGQITPPPLPLDCAVGVDAEAGRIAALLSELEGKDIHAVIAEGKTKLAAMPAVGAAPAAGGAAAAPAAGAAAPAAAKKEEKKEESDEVGTALFNGSWHACLFGAWLIFSCAPLAGHGILSFRLVLPSRFICHSLDVTIHRRKSETLRHSKALQSSEGNTESRVLIFLQHIKNPKKNDPMHNPITSRCLR